MKRIVYILLFGVLFACNNATSFQPMISENIDCSVIEDENFHLSSIASIQTIVPLETNDSCLIGRIDKIEFLNNEVYVLDREYGIRLLVFDRNDGHFIFSIGKMGRGPGEYMSICDFSIDKRNNLIYLLCDKNRLLVYSLLSGEFQTDFAMDFYAASMELKNDRIYFVRDERDNCNLVTTDLKGRILHEEVTPCDYGDSFVLLAHPFCCTSQNLLYRMFLNNIIYEIGKDGKLNGFYKVDFGEREIDNNAIGKYSYEELKKEIANARGKIKYLTANDDFLFLLFFDNNKPCISIYDKRNKEAHSYYYSDAKDDLLGLKQFPLLEYTTDKDEFVAILQPSMLMDIKSGAQSVIETKEKELTDDMNPILYILKTINN